MKEKPTIPSPSTVAVSAKQPFTLTSFFQALVAILICQAAGLIGTIFTFNSISTWYVTLNKPFFNPPNWIFGPVWTILYTMMGISLFLVWRERENNSDVHVALRWFFGQLILNTLWTIVFFGQKNLWLAFGVILVMWFSIFKSIVKFMPISRAAGWLLVPYLAWVSFAMLLNVSVAFLN